MWEFTGKRTRVVDGKSVTDEVEPIAGIGWGPLTDAEFEEAVAIYEALFDDEQKGAVKASGLYKHVPNPPRAAKPEQPALEEEARP